MTSYQVVYGNKIKFCFGDEMSLINGNISSGVNRSFKWVCYASLRKNPFYQCNALNHNKILNENKIMASSN